MVWVRVRMTRALAGPALGMALALAAPAAAHAQTPPPIPTVTATATPSPTATPTPSVTPTPTPEPAKQTKYTRRVYRDFKRDGVIEACDHTRKTLRRTVKTIRPAFEDSYPDFRDAVEAAIKQWDKGKCKAVDHGVTTPTPTPTPTATTTPAAPPAAPPPPPPSSGGTIPKPPRHTRTPVPTPTATIPPAPTPTPTPTTPPTAAQQEAQAVVSRPGSDPSLLVPGILAGLVLLGAAGAAGSALIGSRSARFAVVGQAWREAAFRASGTWGDFTDWLRLGR
jgi:outer membrane biosynthesis protein TonB